MTTRKKKSDNRRKKDAGHQPAKCFVIMPFGIPFDRYYENIYAPASVDCGLDPVRADSLFRSTPIIEDIWEFTQEAKVLIADMTGKNPNVFYELGLAHAIGKPVILVAENVDDIPFDLRALRVLIYNKDDESWGTKLREKITKALEETIKNITSAIPTPFLNPKPVIRPTEDTTSIEFRRIWDELRALRTEREYMYNMPRRFPLPPFVEEPEQVPEPFADAVPLQEILNRMGKKFDFQINRDFSERDIGIAISYLRQNRKIAAIKHLRTSNKWGLKECKDFVDYLEQIMTEIGIS